jgi:hypothetical protein
VGDRVVIGSFRRFWLRRLLPSQIVDETHVIPEADLRAAIAAAPCEPTRAPDLVARTAANRAAHYRAHGEDPDANWGPWVNPYDEDPR